MDIQEIDDEKLFIMKSLDPRQQEILFNKYKFQATKDYAGKLKNLTKNSPFIIHFKRLHKFFEEIIVCMCREYQII